MESMGDLVNGHKEKELLKKLEKDYIVQCIANDEQSLAQDKRKKQMNKLKNQQLFSVLDQQREEKKKRLIDEINAEKSYIESEKKLDNDYSQQQRELGRKRREDQQAYAHQLKQMMKKDFVPLGFEAKLLHKHELGGMLNNHEAQINKRLLMEIAERKRQTSIGPISNTGSPGKED